MGICGENNWCIYDSTIKLHYVDMDILNLTFFPVGKYHKCEWCNNTIIFWYIRTTMCYAYIKILLVMKTNWIVSVYTIGTCFAQMHFIQIFSIIFAYFQKYVYFEFVLLLWQWILPLSLSILQQKRHILSQYWVGISTWRVGSQGQRPKDSWE